MNSNADKTDIENSENKYNTQNIYTSNDSIDKIEVNKEDRFNLLKKISNFSNNEGYTNNEIVFKNYLPNDTNKYKILNMNYFNEVTKIEKIVSKQTKKSVKEFLSLENNTLSIINKEQNTDLKRNIADKLNKLNRRTEIALAEIQLEDKQNKNGISNTDN